MDQSQLEGQGHDGDENLKGRRRREAKIEINEAVDQAKRYIIHNRFQDANRLVYETMTKSIGPGCFEEQSIELLPAFFVLAEANICLGGSRLKKAENFLVSAFWNLLKSTSDESEKKGDDGFAPEKEDIDRYKAGLHKTFGRFFLAQNSAESYPQAVEHMTKGIYLDCVEHGPESIQMCSPYYYMAELFKKEGELHKAKAFYSKIIQIWRKFILKNDFDEMQEYTYSQIDTMMYEEADQHLRNMLIFFEMEFGQHHTVTAECMFAYGLVSLKIGNDMVGHESIQKAHAIYANNLGEFDDKTKEVEETLIKVEQRFKNQQE